MTDYAEEYKKYSRAEEKIADFREKGGIYRHLFSLPFRWAKKYYAIKTLNILKNETELPTLNNNSGIVVSLTSFPARISTLYLVIKSLLKQTVLPEKIILWLSEEEFPDRMENIPQELKNLCRNGLEIVFVPDNLRSHKKYFYAFEKYCDKKVITVDDDLIYDQNILAKLVRMNQTFPQSVCANVVRKMATEKQKFRPYKQWKKQRKTPLTTSHEYIAIGYGGVLYPPNCFDNEVLNVEAIKTICFFADDLWLKANELKQNISVASGGDNFAHPIIIPHSQKIRLQKTNNSSSNRNNDQWNALREYFNLDAIYCSKFS